MKVGEYLWLQQCGLMMREDHLIYFLKIIGRIMDSVQMWHSTGTQDHAPKP
jgi:hypothetical protein